MCVCVYIYIYIVCLYYIYIYIYDVYTHTHAGIYVYINKSMTSPAESSRTQSCPVARFNGCEWSSGEKNDGERASSAWLRSRFPCAEIHRTNFMRAISCCIGTYRLAAASWHRYTASWGSGHMHI